MTSVFISYRRETAAGEARALYTDLATLLGESAVFMDVDSISLGRDFRTELHKTLEACDLMLVIIDREWTMVKDDKGRVRLANPNDYVRMEIEAALKRDIVITPVLVQGARMPAAEDLPAEIANLAYRNGFEVSHGRWASDIREMSRRLKLERPTPAAAAPAHVSEVPKAAAIPAQPPEVPKAESNVQLKTGFFANRTAIAGLVGALLLVVAIGLYWSGIFSPRAPEPISTAGTGKPQISVYAQVNKESDRNKYNALRNSLAGGVYLVKDLEVVNKPIPKNEVRYCDPMNKDDALALKSKLESLNFNKFDVRLDKCSREETKNVLEVSLQS